MTGVDTFAARRVSLAIHKYGRVFIVGIIVVIRVFVDIDWIGRCWVGLGKTTIWVGASHEVDLSKRIVVDIIPARNSPHLLFPKDRVLVVCG